MASKNLLLVVLLPVLIAVAAHYHRQGTLVLPEQLWQSVQAHLPEHVVQQLTALGRRDTSAATGQQSQGASKPAAAAGGGTSVPTQVNVSMLCICVRTQGNCSHPTASLDTLRLGPREDSSLPPPGHIPRLLHTKVTQNSNNNNNNPTNRPQAAQIQVVAASADSGQCQIPGKVDSDLSDCTYAAVHSLNHHHVNPVVRQLVKTAFFRYFKVRYEWCCSLWLRLGLGVGLGGQHVVAVCLHSQASSQGAEAVAIRMCRGCSNTSSV